LQGSTATSVSKSVFSRHYNNHKHSSSSSLSEQRKIKKSKFLIPWKSKWCDVTKNYAEVQLQSRALLTQIPSSSSWSTTTTTKTMFSSSAALFASGTMQLLFI
jgi:hypothetical protein